MVTMEKMSYDEARRKCRCPWRQDLELMCFETDCDKVGCEIWLRQSGLLAHSINEARQP